MEVLEVFLVRPGGPFWADKDFGAGSIPKGEFGPDEDPLLGTKREFEEETGYQASGQFRPLTPIKQPRGKVVHAWTVEGDCDATAIRSNTFLMEWPPHSGKLQEFPEVDRATWLAIDEAKEQILKGKRGFLEELRQLLGEDFPTTTPQEAIPSKGKEEKSEQPSFFG